jgi:hypothetical protein
LVLCLLTLAQVAGAVVMEAVVVGGMTASAFIVAAMVEVLSIMVDITGMAVMAVMAAGR